MPIGEVPGTEVEWQLDAIDLRMVERQLALMNAEAGPVRVGVAPPRRLVDTYVDTEDWRIGRAGYSLRVRRRRGQFMATLKSLEHRSTGPQSRTEIEEVLAAPELLVTTSGPVGSRVRALCGWRPLRVILEVHTRRRSRPLWIADELVGELALDESSIARPGERHTVHLRRVEIELAPGHRPRELAAFVEELSAACHLQRAALSKFASGLLAAGLVIPTVARPERPELGPDPGVGELLYAAGRREAAVILSAEAGARLGDDPEALHGMRSATRRLLLVARLAATVEAPTLLEGLDELEHLHRLLGAVRDLDVQIARSERVRSLAPHAERAALGSLIGHLGARRSLERAALLEGLDSPGIDRLARELERLASSSAPARELEPHGVVVLEGRLRRAHRRASRAARDAASSGEIAQWHRLRRRTKELRDLVELSRVLFGEEARRYSRRLAELLEVLGELHDLSVASTSISDFALGPPARPAAEIFTLGAVVERDRRAIEELLRLARRDAEVLSGGRWRRLSEVAARRREELTPEVPTDPGPSEDSSEDSATPEAHETAAEGDAGGLPGGDPVA